MKTLFLFFSICSLNVLFCQSLQRKVQFGARVEFVTENGASGCKVLQVVRGTSVALQLQEKDLILKIGNSTFSSTDEFIRLFMEYSPDQEVQLTVLRGKKELVLKVKAIALKGKEDYVPTPPKIQTILVDSGHISPLEEPLKATELITFLLETNEK
jgi:hypothetical protein